MNHELILKDQDGHEVGRRPMLPEERYELGRICMNHEVFEYDGKRYKALKGAWQIPEENFICTVKFESWLYLDDC